jgi:hypothetical protein
VTPGREDYAVFNAFWRSVFGDQVGGWRLAVVKRLTDQQRLLGWLVGEGRLRWRERAHAGAMHCRHRLCESCLPLREVGQPRKNGVTE